MGFADGFVAADDDVLTRFEAGADFDEIGIGATEVDAEGGGFPGVAVG